MAISKFPTFFCLLATFLIFFEDNNIAFCGEIRDKGMEKKIVELVNKARMHGAICGGKHYRPAPPVVWNDNLGRASLNHVSDMAGKDFLYHTGSDGSSTKDRIERVKYSWSAFGENISVGHGTPEEVVKAWLKSKGHCENIMNPRFREAGAAYARGSRDIYRTLILATPR